MTSTNKSTAAIIGFCRRVKLRTAFPTALLLTALAVGPAFHGATADGVSAPVPQETPPTKIPLLVVLVEYEDYKLVFTDADWNKKIFSMPTKKEEEQRFDLFGFCGSSVNNFLKDTTSGKFLFEPAAETCGTPNDGVIRIRLNRKHPKNDPKAGSPVGQALRKVSQYMDLAKYDLDKDKRLDGKELLIVAVFAGGEADQTQTGYFCTYGRQSMGGGYSRNATVVMTERRDGLREKYAELTRQAKVESKYKDFPPSVGTLVHELGHHLGSPDLANTGYYDTMALEKDVETRTPFSRGQR